MNPAADKQGSGNTCCHAVRKLFSMYGRNHPDGFPKPFRWFPLNHSVCFLGTILMVFLKPSRLFFRRAEGSGGRMVREAEQVAFVVRHRIR